MTLPGKTPAALGAGEEATVDWQTGWSLLRRFWPYLRPHRRLTVLIGIVLLLGVPGQVISPYLVQRLFDGALPDQDMTALLTLSVAMIGLTLLSTGLDYCHEVLSVRLHARVEYRLTCGLFGRVLRLPLSEIQRSETGYLMSRVDDDVDALEALMPDSLLEAAFEAVKCVLFFVLLVLLDPGLALAGLALLLVILVGVLVAARPLRRMNARVLETEARNSSVLQEAIAGLLTTRTAAQEARERWRFHRATQVMTRAWARRDIFGAATGTAIGSIASLGAYVLIAVGAYRIMTGDSSIGSLFAFFIFLMQMVGSGSAVYSLLPTAQLSFASLQRIFEIMDERIEPQGGAKPASRPSGEIELRGVSFRYGTGPVVLHDVDLRIAPGEVLALVGRSGSGKSTLVHLVPRLHEPTKGQVLLDGRPLEELNLRWLRRHVGFVHQDPFLFNRSVRENIAYACPDATESEIREAARAAHAEEFILKLPDGLETVIGERGVRLSGGEKQRVAIARELLRDPPILILDEATSSLDSEGDLLVRQAIERVMMGRTCLVIAHRLSTVRRADRIAVLDEGRIVELGTHEELLGQAGIYRYLRDHQMSGEVL